MAVDTRYKRGSALALILPFITPLAQPATAGVDQLERQAVTWCYSGILAAALDAVVNVEAEYMFWAGSEFERIEFIHPQKATYIFENTTERDTYFSAWPAQKKTDTLITLKGTNTNVAILQRWTGSAWATQNLPYGSLYGNEIAWTQANAVQNTWYEIIDASIANGLLSNITHDGNGKLTALEAGIYLGIWSVTSTVDAANKHIQIAFCVDGSAMEAAGMNHYESTGISREFPIPGQTHLNLSANATVAVAIRTTDTGTPDISVDHINLSINQIALP